VRRPSLSEHRADRVEESFDSMPERFVGGEPGIEASYEVRIEDLGRAWLVELG
jgi:hypothetical protein